MPSIIVLHIYLHVSLWLWYVHFNTCVIFCCYVYIIVHLLQTFALYFLASTSNSHTCLLVHDVRVSGNIYLGMVFLCSAIADNARLFFQSGVPISFVPVLYMGSH